MNETSLFLNAYYETLYDRLTASKDALCAKIEEILQEEIMKLGLGDVDKDKYAAYRDACFAFVDERLETYNPIGVQYTFDRLRTKEAIELELQLNWYDSSEEFNNLLEAARAKAHADMSDQRLQELVDEVIKELGAFPDNSIISTYKTAPALGKLPDYVVASAIEEIVRQ